MRSVGNQRKVGGNKLKQLKRGGNHLIQMVLINKVDNFSTMVSLGTSDTIRFYLVQANDVILIKEVKYNKIFLVWYHTETINKNQTTSKTSGAQK